MDDGCCKCHDCQAKECESCGQLIKSEDDLVTLGPYDYHVQCWQDLKIMCPLEYMEQWGE